MKLSSDVRNNPPEPDFFPVHLNALEVAPELAPRHGHAGEFEWFFCLAGGGVQVAGDWRGRVKPGQLAVIPPGVPHVFCADPSGCDCEVLMLAPEWLEGSGAIMTEARGLLHFWKDRAENAGFLPLLPSVAVERVRAGLRASSRIGLCGAILELLGLAFQLDDAPPERAGERQDEDIRRVLYHINNHFARKISVGEALRLAGISRSAFHKRFLAATGLTFCRYLNRQRLAAVEWMVRSGVPREEAARRCGFGSRSNYYQQLRLERDEARPGI